jgi:hypothetical protein
MRTQAVIFIPDLEFVVFYFLVYYLFYLHCWLVNGPLANI